MDVKKLFRKDFSVLDPYHPVKPLEVLAEEIGVPVGKLVKLDANENLYGPIDEARLAAFAEDPLLPHLPSPMLAQITAAITACKVLHIYPDPTQSYFRRALSVFLHLPEEFFCGGTGSDELLDLVLRLFEPAAIVNLPPTFGMYPFLVRIAKAQMHGGDPSTVPASISPPLPCVCRASSLIRASSTSRGGQHRHSRCTLRASLQLSLLAPASSTRPRQTTPRAACCRTRRSAW
jgi:histidinol-phosphate aminotransferase